MTNAYEGADAPGDVRLLLADTLYRLRLTFGAALAIEQDCGAGLVDVTINRLHRGEIGVLAKVLHRLLEAGGHTIDLEKAGKLVMANYQDALKAVYACLSEALVGDEMTDDQASLSASGPIDPEPDAGPDDGKKPLSQL